MYKVLVCDDEKDIVSAISIYLTSDGYEVIPARNGLEALDIVKHNDVHLVLMDIMMPGIDGLEATRQIRALDREDAATTPIIAVSANAFADDRRLSREAGMDAHLSKPVSSQELVEALAHIAADAS